MMYGRDFRAWRDRLGLTQMQVAVRLGISQRAIAAWESDATPISRQTEMAIWAIERCIGLERELEMLESGKMTTGEKRRQGNAFVDVDTTAESIERVRSHIAELDAMVADHQASNRRYGVAFDVGEPLRSTNGFCVSIRNAHRGPITSIEYASEEEAEAATKALRSAIEPAIAVTDTRGKTW
ncbi:MAG TPA: helix-turn-helix domain-containing protein [Stellaceae bacterium]|nr:helix-turn-helix domain-containing protein [Stellaceae bacterium]